MDCIHRDSNSDPLLIRWKSGRQILYPSTMDAWMKVVNLISNKYPTTTSILIPFHRVGFPLKVDIIH